MATIKQIADFDKAIETKKKEINGIIKERSKALETVMADKGKSFTQGGKYYQIRVRKGNYFLVSSPIPFGSWLKKENRKKNVVKQDKTVDNNETVVTD